MDELNEWKHIRVDTTDGTIVCEGIAADFINYNFDAAIK